MTRMLHFLVAGGMSVASSARVDKASILMSDSIKSEDVGTLMSEDAKLLMGEGARREDCSWAKLDTSTGWRCESIKRFTGGMQGNTKLVKLFPPDSRPPFLAVLKEMNSNQNPGGLHSLENERRIAEHLMSKGFTHMPEYYLDLAVESKYQKYVHSARMTLAEKDNCDNKRSSAGICEISPAWNICNGNRGNIDTTVEIPLSRIRRDGLKCPDTQVLAMEFLEGYQDLKGLQATLSGESAFHREVRAAALFRAYDGMRAAGVSHCDFNPGNAMFKVGDPSAAKIIDFGLARMNDHPFGACRGNLEDVGRPGFLWLALYRGQRDEMEFAQNERTAGPLSLSSGQAFQVPSGDQMQPFSFMRGSYNGVGGTLPWNRETRDNWPGIIAYANVLLAKFAQEGSGGTISRPSLDSQSTGKDPGSTASKTPSKRPLDVATVVPSKRPAHHTGQAETSDDMRVDSGSKPTDEGRFVVVRTRELAQQLSNADVEYEGMRGIARRATIKGQAVSFNFEPADGGSTQWGVRIYWASNSGKLKMSVG